MYCKKDIFEVERGKEGGKDAERADRRMDVPCTLGCQGSWVTITSTWAEASVNGSNSNTNQTLA
jgi:hypothetical protein